MNLSALTPRMLRTHRRVHTTAVHDHVQPAAASRRVALLGGSAALLCAQQPPASQAKRSKDNKSYTDATTLDEATSATGGIRLPQLAWCMAHPAWGRTPHALG